MISSSVVGSRTWPGGSKTSSIVTWPRGSPPGPSAEKSSGISRAGPGEVAKTRSKTARV